MTRTTIDPDTLATRLAPVVLRTDLSAPGFHLLDLGTDLTPRDCRGHMVALGRALARHYSARFGQSLCFLSVSRFDQQSSTRPHRDGGPDGSLLLLGYEPSEVASRLYLLDHSRAAAGLGLHPRDFLDRYNPTFGEGVALLAGHTSEVRGFTPDRFQLLLVNNGCLEADTGMLGVLHHAVIDTPQQGKSRFIDSVQMGVAIEGLDEAQLAAFVEAAVAASQ